MTHPPHIPLSEHAARRKKVRQALKQSVGLVFAGEHDSHSGTPFRPHPHFEYLTGVTDEPGAVLLLDPANPVEARREVLFLRPLNPEAEKWDGYRLEIGSELREKVGFKAIFRHAMLPRTLGSAAKRSKSVACLHPLANHDQPVSPDLDIFRRLEQRIPGLAIDDRSEELIRHRAVKSKTERDMIRHAVNITAAGFEAVMMNVQPGMNEQELQAILEHEYRRRGSKRTAFPTIAGSGLNSTVLHYEANDQEIEDGDLICIDSGATWGGYAADVTRTIPANGRFTDRQREIYEIVLRAQETAIRAAKPGVRLSELDGAARAIIRKAGYGDSFPHSIGHHLGLETHDASPDEPLKEGAVITIEPGIYLPDEKIGIRIEDDIAITRSGSRNLSKAIPKKVDEIESLMNP